MVLRLRSDTDIKALTSAQLYYAMQNVMLHV